MSEYASFFIFYEAVNESFAFVYFIYLCFNKFCCVLHAELLDIDCLLYLDGIDIG